MKRKRIETSKTDLERSKPGGHLQELEQATKSKNYALMWVVKMEREVANDNQIARKLLDVVKERPEVTLRRIGLWLCGVCFKTHTLWTKCRHGKDIVPPPDCGDFVVRFVLYDLTKPQVPSCSKQIDQVEYLLHDQHSGFTLALLDSLFLKGLRTVKFIPPKCRLGFSRVLKGGLDKVICKPDDISCWVSLLVLPLCLLKTFVPRSNLEYVGDEDIDLGERNIKQCKKKIPDGHYTAAVRVLSSSGVAPYSDATLEDLKTKHHFKPAPSLPRIPFDHHHLIASPSLVLDRIKSFPRGTSCERDGLRTQHLIHCLSGSDVAIFDELVSSITQMVNLFLGGCCPKMLGEYIASAPLTPLDRPGGGIRPSYTFSCVHARPVSLSLLNVLLTWLFFLLWSVLRLVFKVSAVLISHSLDGYFHDLQFSVGVSGGGEAILHAVNRLIEGRRDDVGLSMLLANFKNAFNLLDCTMGITPYGHAKGLSLQAWYLDDDTIIGDTLVVRKILELIMKDGPRCGLHLNVDKTEMAQRAFDAALCSALKRIVTASGPGFGDWQWRLATLSFAFGGLGVYCAGDVLIYAFLASKLQSASLQTKLLRHSSIVASGPAFNDALCAFNTKMKTGLLSNASEIAASKLMKKWADIYFTRVTQTAKPTFSLSSRQMALWQSQMEDHTSDWLRAVPISGLGQTMNGKTYRDIYGDHAVSCASIIGIKHRHNVVRDTLVDICFRSGISAGKEVDIGLGGGCDKPLCPADMLLYSWDEGLDVCVDLTGSSPLMQTGIVDFVPGRAVIDEAHRKRVKYEAKCANIGYDFLPFSFSSFGELEKDAVNLLKRVQKFSVTQDIGARTVVHIFNRISFAVAKGVGAQLVSRLPANFL
ncbi:hypothetical protein Tco_1427744 [Tanacetum coccineum]